MIRKEELIDKGVQTRERIMDAIISFVEKHQYFPSYREIGEMVGLKSTSSVHLQVSKLIQEGRLESDTEYIQPRAIRIPGYRFVKEEEA